MSIASIAAKPRASSLSLIAPKRMNPDGRAWLRILCTSRDDWHFTALYSHTPRAHELGKTRDWVAIYAYDDHRVEQQCTVITETRGELRGHRIVRGREAECVAFQQHASANRP